MGPITEISAYAAQFEPERLDRDDFGAVTGRVRKQRWLLQAGQTRIHLDRVEGLGDFIELEVVLRDGQSDAEGAAIAQALMQALGLADAPRVAGAYLDLLRADGVSSAHFAPQAPLPPPARTDPGEPRCS